MGWNPESLASPPFEGGIQKAAVAEALEATVGVHAAFESLRQRDIHPNEALSPAKTRSDSLAPLIAEVRQIIQSARGGAASVVNTLQVMTNFEIGRRIVEHEQKGEKRAEYGAELLKELSARLTVEFGRGFSITNLKLMRQFFVENRHRMGQQATDLFRISRQSAENES